MNSNRFSRTALWAFFAFSLTAVFAVSASAQLGGLGGLGDKLKKKTPNLLGDKQPITTSLSDAKWGRADMDGTTPLS